MTSMDKRKGTLIGRPKRIVVNWVVLKKPLVHGEITVEKLFTNRGKADAYVDERIAVGDGHRYWTERWAVD